MKRFVAGIVVGLLLTLAGAAVAAPGAIRLIVNSQELPCQPAPRLIDGSVFVPVRFVSEALGARVQWQSETNSVIITIENPEKEDNVMSSINGTDWVRISDLVTSYGITVTLGDMVTFSKDGITISVPTPDARGPEIIHSFNTDRGLLHLRAQEGGLWASPNELKNLGLIP